MVRFLFKKIATLALASIFSRIISIIARSNFARRHCIRSFEQAVPCFARILFQELVQIGRNKQIGRNGIILYFTKTKTICTAAEKSITYSLCNSSSVIIQCSFRSATLYRWLAGRLLLHLSGSVSAPSDALLRYLSFRGWYQSLRTSHPDMRQFHFALITVGKMF